MTTTLVPSNTVPFVRYLSESGACRGCELKHEHALMQFVQQSIVNANDLNASRIQVLVQTYLMRTDSAPALKLRIRELANCCFLGMPLPLTPKTSFLENISIFDNNTFVGENEEETKEAVFNNVLPLPKDRFTFEALKKADEQDHNYETNIRASLRWAKENMTHFRLQEAVGAGGLYKDDTLGIEFNVQHFDNRADPTQDAYDEAFGYYKWIKAEQGNILKPGTTDTQGVVVVGGTMTNNFQFAKKDDVTFHNIQLSDDIIVHVTYDAEPNLLTAPETPGRVKVAGIQAGDADEALTSDFARMSLRGAGRGLGLRPQELAEVLELAS